MLQTPKFDRLISENKISFTKDTNIKIPKCDYKSYIQKEFDKLIEAPTSEDSIKCVSVTFSIGIPDSLLTGIAGEVEFTDNDEEYVLLLGENTCVYAKTNVGFLRALSTILQLHDSDELFARFIYDYPASPERGYRVYMPGHETMKYFLEMIDFLVYYKYNSIIIEVGGAMEYERHPRINEQWVEFCKDVGKYSGRADEIQHSFAWSKNSIHYENGDASYLKKDECRELAKYCAERGIEVIPECPTLSHSDYICLAYPEIAELSIDPYPDTYCPSNPRSYEIVFDILDEVVEVFRPKRINIGHDEYYLCGMCDACKGKKPSDLYVEDIRRISEHLSKQGVETLMWGEKLVKARNHKGHKFGAWYDPNEKNPEYSRPNLVDCVDKLPRGITYLHWYWVFGTHLDDEYHGRNYPVIFGNFEPFGCMDFRTRINRGIRGAFVSNWGSVKPEYMQRNLQYFDLVSSAYALWSDTYDNSDEQMLKTLTFNALYKKYCSKIKNPLRVRHSTDYYVKPTRFWDGRFIEDEIYCMGNYEVTYFDGTKVALPVKYGTNIGTSGYTAENVAMDFAAAEGEQVSEGHLREMSYSTLPEKVKSGYVYNHVYENPYPEKKISSIKYLPNAGMEKYNVNYEFELKA